MKNVVAVQNVIRPKMNRDKVIKWRHLMPTTPNRDKSSLPTLWLPAWSPGHCDNYRTNHTACPRAEIWTGKEKTVCSKVCRISVNDRNSLGIDKPLSWRRTTQANAPKIHYNSKPMVRIKYIRTWCNVGRTGYRMLSHTYQNTKSMQ